jgi:16S rRNA (uracil1498-N3)-methyltransferase
VSAALFLAEATDVALADIGDVIALGGSEGRHAVAVKRISVGERIDLGDGAGTVLHTQVESVTGRDTLSARVLRKSRAAAPQPRVVVVQALPKGERAEVAVETLTEVGVDEIVPWQAERCITRWPADKAVRGRAKWGMAARSAGKQARRTWLPEVPELVHTADVEKLVAAAALAVLLHEAAAVPLAQLAVPATGDVVLVVGPEGGLSPQEIERLVAAGAHVARLGPSVLRTSTAGTVAAGIVLAATSRWA